MKLSLNPACPYHFISNFPFKTSFTNGLAAILASISFAALICANCSGVNYPAPGAPVGAPAPEVAAG